jgi:diguanylate cyclase (GGDEF)-like protein
VALLAVVLIAVLVIGLQTLIGRRAADQMAAEIGAGLAEVAQQVADRFDREIWSRSNEIRLAARNLARIGGGDEARMAGIVGGLQSTFPSVVWVGYVGADGRCLAASGRGPQIGDAFPDRDLLAAADRPLVMDTHRRTAGEDGSPGPHLLAVAAPAVAPDGRQRGTLVAWLGWDWGRDIQRDLGRALRRDRPLEILVADAAGQVIIGPEAAIGQPVPRGSAMPAATGRNGWVVADWPDLPDARQLTGHAAVIGRGDLGVVGWTVHVRLPERVALAPVDGLRRTVLIWGLGGGLIMALAGWVAAGWIARPLRRIAQAADRIRSGDDGVEIPEVGGATEVELLSRSLRALIDRLTHSRSELDHALSAAGRDALTGLPNRRFFDEVLHLLTDRIAAHDGTLGVIFMDLDGFKAVNDVHGHAAGDQLLIAVAGRLAHAVRERDVAIRLGGDEFVVLLDLEGEDPAGQARRTAERLIALVGLPVPLGERAAVTVGGSAGVALWPADHADPREVLELADAALYAVKRGGRGHVRLHDGAVQGFVSRNN